MSAIVDVVVRILLKDSPISTLHNIIVNPNSCPGQPIARAQESRRPDSIRGASGSE